MIAIDVSASLVASGSSAAHSVAAVVLIEAANRRHGAEVLSEFVMKPARQMPALLLLIVDQLGSERGFFAGRQLEVRRQPVEYLANALKFDKPEAWKPDSR